MPKAKPASPPEPPAPVSEKEERFILGVIRRYYGDDATIRNWGSDPKRLQLHVEASVDIGSRRNDCLGELMCEINRNYIGLDVTWPGQRLRGNSKLAYRQGVILGQPDAKVR
jgi:hypothetical protein